MPDRIIVGDVTELVEEVQQWRDGYQVETLSFSDGSVTRGREHLPEAVEDLLERLADTLETTARENERLRGERDGMADHLMNLLGASACSIHQETIRGESFREFQNLELNMGCHRCLKERLAALQAAVEPFMKVAQRATQDNIHATLSQLELVSRKELCLSDWRNLLAAYDQQPSTHPEENCPSSECPEHGRRELGKERG